MSTCTKCLQKEADLRCKMCHRPICKDCGIMEPAGIFCSEVCAQKMQAHIERTKEIDQERPIIKQKRVPTIVKLIIWLAALWFVARFILNVNIIESIKELISLVIAKVPK
jgi:hypothetical protein